MNDLLISALVEVLQIALLADKKEVSGEAIEKLLRESALENNADISDEFRKISGFGIGEVFVKMISDNTTPEIAAAQLELERNQLTIH